MLTIENFKQEAEKLSTSHLSLSQIERLETLLSKIKNTVEKKVEESNNDDFNSKQEQTLLEKIIENNPYAIGIADKNGRILRVNKSFYNLFTTMPPDNYSIFSNPVIKKQFPEEIKKIKSGETSHIPELWFSASLFAENIPLKDLCVKTTIFPIKDDTDAITNYIILHQDITEIKNAERDLLEKEKKYRLIFENIQNIYFECNLEGIITEVSPSVENLSGYKKDELLGMNVSRIYADPAQRADILDTIFKDGFKKNYTVDFLDKNGEKKKCLTSCQLIINEAGIPTGISGSIVDINELHRMEEKLRQSEEKYRDLFEKANDLICTLDFDGTVTSVNPVAEFKLGYNLCKRKDCHISKFVTPESYELIKSHILKKLENIEINSRYEVEAVAKNGSHLFFEVSSFLRCKNNKPSEIFAIARDITERKKAEEELSKTRERYQELFKSTSDIVYTMDFQGNFTSVNPVVEKVLGYNFNELKKPNMADYISPATNKLAAENIQKKLRHEAENTTYEVEFIKKDGTYTTFEINSFLRYINGKPSEIFGIARDITERNRLTEILKRSEEKYRRIFENAPLGIMIADKEGNIIEINPALLQMLGSKSESETKKINILKFPLLVNSGVTENFMRCMETGEPLSSEHDYTSKWGKKLYSRVYTKPLPDATGIIKGFQSIIEDITEEKEAANLLTKSVQEKEALLREIHHRVKNNLQIIISLINIQVSDIEDAKFKQKFLELQQRVRTMSIIHEDLYMSKDLSRVNFGNYIQRLTVNLKQIYQCNKMIDLHFSVSDEIALEIDTAIPLGIIVNELVSNSFKHAFPEDAANGKVRHKNSIDVEFAETKEEFQLTIADNGIGFHKKKFGDSEETLGLSLVDILISQLRGTFKFKNQTGAMYEISIPKKQEN